MALLLDEFLKVPKPNYVHIESAWGEITPRHYALFN